MTEFAGMTTAYEVATSTSHNTTTNIRSDRSMPTLFTTTTVIDKNVVTPVDIEIVQTCPLQSDMDSSGVVPIHRYAILEGETSSCTSQTKDSCILSDKDDLLSE